MIAQPQLQCIYSGETTRRSCIFSKQEVRSRRHKAIKRSFALAMVLALILTLILIFGDYVKTPASGSSGTQQLSMSAAIDRASQSSSLTATIHSDQAASTQAAVSEAVVRVS